MLSSQESKEIKTSSVAISEIDKKAPSEEILDFFKTGLELIKKYQSKPPISESAITDVFKYFSLCSEDENTLTYALHFSSPRHPDLKPFDKQLAEFILLAANQGCVKAQYHVGLSYERGFNLLNEDPFTKNSFEFRENSFNWYERAAAQNHAGALYKLGCHYSLIPSFTVHKDRVFNLYKQSALLGDDRAQVELAELLRVEHNNEKKYNKRIKLLFEATKWLKKAVTKNNDNAILYLAIYYHEGNALPQNSLVALQMLCRVLEMTSADNEEAAAFAGQLMTQIIAKISPNLLQLSFEQAGYLFYAGMALTLLELKSNISKSTRGAVFGFQLVNHFSTIINDFKNEIIVRMKLLPNLHPELFYSLLNQNSNHQDKMLDYFFSANKAEHLTKINTMHTTWLTTLSTHTGLPIDLLNLTSEYIGNPRVQLPIEIFANCIRKFIEDLCEFTENPESSAAKESKRLLTEINPFTDLLIKPMLSTGKRGAEKPMLDTKRIAEEFEKFRSWLMTEKNNLTSSSSSNNPKLYKTIHPITVVIDNALKMIKEYMGPVKSEHIEQNNNSRCLIQ